MDLHGFASRLYTDAKIRDGNSETGGRCRGLQGGGGTGRSSGVCLPRNHCPRFVVGAVLKLGQSRVSCRVVVSPKLPALCDIVYLGTVVIDTAGKKSKGCFASR